MKILIISSFLPYPLFSGGNIRLFNIIKNLSQRHEVTLVCERRQHQTEKDVEEVKKYCEELITVDRKKQWTFSNILRTGFSPFPFLLVGHKNDEMKRSITRLLNHKLFDVIHVETFYVMQNLPDTSLPVVLVEHNIEHLVYKRYAQRASFLLRPLLYFDVMKLRYWEEVFWEKATKLVAVSEEEKKIMGRGDTEVIPNGVDTKKYQISNIKYQKTKREKRILFIGDFKWIQNRDAAAWILKEIWPSFVRLWQTSGGKPNVKLWIVGRKIPDEIRKLTNDENVIFDENASEETAEIFQKADVLLAPIRIGGGTSFKILEAMASGIAVVTTTLGREGIEARDKKEVLIADTVGDIADIVISLLENNEQCQEIARNARKLIEEKYDWKIVVKILEKVYKDAIGKYG